jgi:PAS domain S-box-containing protein
VRWISAKAANLKDTVLSQLFACDSPAWIFDQETLAFMEVNEHAIQQYGYSRQEFLNMTILDIRPTEDIELILHQALRPDIKHLTHHELWRHRSKDGRVFRTEINSRELTFRGRPAEMVTAKRLLDASS